MSDDIRSKARKKLQRADQIRRDARFRRTIAKLVEAKLMFSNIADLPSAPKKLMLDDALFAGQVEPRVYELLPAIMIKRPNLIRAPKKLPQDLADTLDAIRDGQELPTFRGVAPSKYLHWIETTGRPGRGPSTLKAYRLRPIDLARLRRLRTLLDADSDTEVLRIALRTLEGVVA